MSAAISMLMKRLEELERRVAQMVIRGKIHAVDPVKHVARVAYGPRGKQQLTGWLQWKPQRTGKAIVWWVPEIGEGVTVISDGDLTLGEIFPGSYHKDFTAPSQDPNEFLVLFGDGSKVSHNRESHKLEVVNKGDVTVTAVGVVEVHASKDLTLSTNADMTLTASGKMKLSASRIDFN